MAKDATPTHKAVMLKTVNGSPDGNKVRQYKENTIQNLPKHLFEAFKNMGAVKLAEDKAKVTKETKVEQPQELAVEKYEETVEPPKPVAAPKPAKAKRRGKK